jgi:serine/threonine protein kinase
VSKFSNSTSYYLPKYYSCAKMPDFVIMERLIGEELDFFVELRNEYISLWTKIYLFINVVKGVRHLISLGIVHLDLKPINIIVCKFMITKIIDFG